MKKIFLTGILSLGGLISFAQFNESSYKAIKLGMSKEEVSKIVTLTFDKDYEGSATGVYNGLVLDFNFSGDNLFGLTSSDEKATVVGFPEKTFIGKTKKEVKAILGKKLENAELDEVSENYYIYYATPAAYKDEEKVCLFYFNDEEILEYIGASFRP